MALRSHRPGCPGARHCLTALLWLLTAEPLLAQTPAAIDAEQPRATASPGMEQRIRQLEQSLAEVVEQNRQLATQIRELSAQNRRPVAPEPLAAPTIPDPTIPLVSAVTDQLTDDVDDAALVQPPAASDPGAANTL